MKKLSLVAYADAKTTLEFEWDPETGELAGRDADEVRRYAEEAKRQGYWTGHPRSTPYRIEDPLRRPAEMAVILGNAWRLPPELAAVYPRPPQGNELPPGAIA